MNRLRLAFIFFIFYALLLGGVYSSVSQEQAKPEPERQWATSLPGDAK